MPLIHTVSQLLIAADFFSLSGIHIGKFIHGFVPTNLFSLRSLVAFTLFALIIRFVIRFRSTYCISWLRGETSALDD